MKPTFSWSLDIENEHRAAGALLVVPKCLQSPPGPPPEENAKKAVALFARHKSKMMELAVAAALLVDVNESMLRVST